MSTFIFGEGGSTTKTLDCSTKGGVSKLNVKGGDALDTITVTCNDGTSEKMGTSTGGNSTFTADCSGQNGGVNGLRVEIGDFASGIHKYRVISRITPSCNNGIIVSNSVGRPGDMTTFTCPQYETIQQMSAGYGDLQIIDKIDVRCGPMIDCNKGANRNTDYCQAYCTKYPQKCDNSELGKFCTGDNLATSQCITFCNANPEQCDQKYKDYCAQHPNDYNVCGCINFDSDTSKTIQNLSSLGLNIYPTCFVQNCINNNSFRPSIYKGKSCPNQSVCQNNVNAQNIIGQSKGLVNISLGCGENGGGGILGGILGGNGGSGSGSGSGLIIFIVCCFLIMMLSCTGALSGLLAMSKPSHR